MTAPREPKPRNSKATDLDPKLEAARKVAATLFREQGPLKAHKLVRSELRRARRARSRKLYGFWTAVEAELEAVRLVAEPPQRAPVPPSFASTDDARAKAKHTPTPREIAGQVWTSTARSS